MGCTFCATGGMGIVRNLQSGEILSQVLVLMAALGPQRGHELTLVFMGMGEPLHNLDNLHRAIRLLCHPLGLGMGRGRITVSTSGLVSGIEKLAMMVPRPNLALSLNATTDEARSRTMPVNRVWNLARLRQALDNWGPGMASGSASSTCCWPARTTPRLTPSAWRSGWASCGGATT